MNSPQEPVLRSPSESPVLTQMLGFNGAQKILHLLLDYMNDVETAIKLPPTAVLESDSVPGDDITELREELQKHSTLAEEHLKLEHLGTEDGDTEGTSRRAKLDKEIKDSFRDALRLILAHPGAMDALKATLDDDPGESEENISRGLKMFHSQMEETMMGRKSKRQASLHFMAENNKNQILKEETAAMIKKINVMIDQKMKESEALDKHFKQHEQEENKAEKGTEWPPAEGPRLASMQREVNEQNMQLRHLMFEDRQKERLEQEQNLKVEKENEELLHNFDSEMKETQAKREFDGEELRKAEEVMMMLQKPFELLEVEYNKIMERQRLADEKKEKEMKELVIKTKAAIIVQALWRGYRTRSALKNQSKEKKPKKGKGKKK
ncbi:dynein regulatory complex protein 10 [Gouania willdenowi]|uniref:dynein regulatory complex protein 10 n=1 Tax=Gouania willdenowi TaxID=441366 RepID=UPI001055300E|nr:dynein regulatory complex protein 9-like [Gouania willdenowi]XP_028314163.1 dynein regulatory complex protein 9-like [Gouania willdenowi]